MSIIIPTDAGRSRSNAPEKIIIHAMSEFIHYEGTDYYAPHFLNEIGLSCHFMVTPSGHTIQCADFKSRHAWHAKGHNFDSIGIEVLLPGKNDYSQLLQRMRDDWVAPRQFDGLVDLLRKLPKLPLYRHCDLDPMRKEDPGVGFPWLNLLEEFNK